MKFASAIAACLSVLSLAATAAAAPAGAGKANWRDVDPDNLILMQTRYGRIAIELAPQFAPHHVARMRALARAHFYDGLSFYRVIDGYVAQGGLADDVDADVKRVHPKQVAELKRFGPLKAEFDRPISDIAAPFAPTGSPDLFAPETGYVRGFPVGRDPKAGREWIVHCPGTFAFARDVAPDTASTEFYIVIGEAPRRLDRNLTVFGRVIAGMRYVQKLHRGDPNVDNGVIQDPAKRDKILSVRLAADLPAAQRPHYQVMRTPSPAFTAWKKARINPMPAFYVHEPPKILDVCLAPIPARLVPPG